MMKTYRFVNRHIGCGDREIAEMLAEIGIDSLDQLIENVVPKSIRISQPLNLPESLTEKSALDQLRKIATQNKNFRSFIGMGYHKTITPPVIQRNILENPGWYTAYTPYQAEISQGRLEALLNFQTMISDLTGLPIANASLLDEATAAAEAMAMCLAVAKRSTEKIFFVSDQCHPQTIAVVQTRAEPIGIEVIVGDHREIEFEKSILGAIVQYPATNGEIFDYTDFAEKVHDSNGLLIVAADPLSLVILPPPSDFGADVAIGSTQRFGVPIGYGGPHAAYFATKDQFKRKIPGRIVGVSIDAEGRNAIRLSLQTREQHIRREKATSNICTAQVLLAVIAGMFAVYHGPDGICEIAETVHRKTTVLRDLIETIGFEIENENHFDTLTVFADANRVQKIAESIEINLRIFDDRRVGIAIDETTTIDDLRDLIGIFAVLDGKDVPNFESLKMAIDHAPIQLPDQRTTPFLTHPVFNSYHSETEMIRYLHRLQTKDLSLVNSMIPLGSCTMKLNATAEMMPITWSEFADLHPFIPIDQANGYQILFDQLEKWLAEITGFDAISLQPNAGSQGEFAGLLAIREFHKSNNESDRDVCLIPKSAHGTNPASAVMAGMKVIVIECDNDGNIDISDLQQKAQKHRDRLAAAMITYPSTHGVFEEAIREICAIVHVNGGQVYMDGANLNAMVGLCRPGDFGADVCHLNLHKTFCIPHGGGGPGMGPIGVRSHLVPFLPTQKIFSKTAKTDPHLIDGLTISAAPWGSPSILPISWMYIAMMGASGLKRASEIAILNANYIAKRLEPHYKVVYKGANDLVAHECIIDLREFKKSANIDVADVAKRLIDYGFHAPTVSWPIAGTLMIEPTESESKSEIDRFCSAMINIREEIRDLADLENSSVDRNDNVLKNAPHTVTQVIASEWKRSYSREIAAFPLPYLRDRKYWSPVARIDEVHGDRNLICACPPIDAYES